MTETWIEKAKQAIKESSIESSVYVGCDSIRFRGDGKKRRKNGKWKAKYSIVVILHIDSNHGGKIFHHHETIDDYGNLRQRLLNEVNYAVMATQEIIEVIGNRRLEVHLDLNCDPKHKSNIAVKEAIGYVQGMFGFAPKLKSDSWAATHAADYVVRHWH